MPKEDCTSSMACRRKLSICIWKNVNTVLIIEMKTYSFCC
jgi:hypothetical protein